MSDDPKDGEPRIEPSNPVTQAPAVEGGPAPGSAEAEIVQAKWWLANVYRGDKVPQLTFRAVLTGMVLGGVMALSNLYVGFKTGWGLGVTITACILAFALFSTLQRIFPGLRHNEFTILENNMMSSTASAAGYMSSSIFVGAVPALYLAAHKTIGWLPLTLWAAAVSFLGVFMAIPMKRQQINIDQLPFPSGLATAETLRAMHTKGDDAKKKARALAWSALGGALIGWFREAHARWMPFNIPGMWVPKLKIAGQPFERLTIGAELSLIMVGAGAIIGIRVGVSMLVSAIVCYGVLGPWVLNHEWVEPNRYRQAWALWPGVGLLVTSGLTMFFLRWRTIARAFSGLGRLLSGGGGATEDPVAHVEAPQSWFLWGTLVSGVACVVLGAVYFHIAWWMGVIAVLVTFFLSLIASRATGETDITPTGAMGKITQLMYGLIAPGNMTTNLMTASLTGGAAIHSADLLTDLKSGYILGANPRQQFLAQFFGVMAGAFVVVPVFFILIPDINMLATERWPAPAALVWKGVAELLAKGPESLHPTARLGLLIGATLGVILPLLEMRFPKHKKFIPSATGLGLAFTINGFNVVMMFIGALIATLLRKKKPVMAETYIIPVASGIIAGESLMGVTIAFLTVFKVLL